MSENLVALAVACAILLALTLWTPFLHMVCPPCSRFVSRLRRQELPIAPESPSTFTAEADAA